MNDFSELENELKKLRPTQPSAELLARIDAVFAKADSNQKTGDIAKIIHPTRFKVSWLSLGLGLAAAAIFLIFARLVLGRQSTWA